jgi:FKBP-type peptidyl-prolyl cis-trans isomerase FkpA
MRTFLARSRTALLARLTCATALLSTCASTGAVPPEATSYAPSLRVDLSAMQRLPSGIYIRDVRAGQGAAARPGDRVAVHYVGWLPDGTQVEGLAPPSDPLVFRLGERAVIRGWDIGVDGMRPGGQRMLVVPAHLGYGARQVDNVPPDSVLIFLIELVGIR